MTAHQADATWIDGRLVRDAIVTVGDDGRIATVGVGLDVGEQTVERLRGRVLLPGFVNAHSHSFQRLIRGRTEAHPGDRADDFWGWRDAMYHAVEHLDPEGVERIARMAFVEMAMAGWTHVVEFHYVHHQGGGRPYADRNELARRVLAAAEFAGIGITLLRVAYQRGGAGVPPSRGQLRFVDTQEDFVRAFEDLRGVKSTGPRPVNVGIAAHSVRALDRDYLRALASLAPLGPVHAHVSEQPREIEECLAEHGMRPVELLADVGLLSPRFTAVHATHLGPGEAELLGESGSNACICPTTERNLGDGLPDLSALIDAGVTLCLGSDSQARIDPFAELRALEDGERLRTGRRVVLAGEGGTARAVFRAAMSGGARSAGLDAGRIEVGARADLVTVRVDEPAFAGTSMGPGSEEALAEALVLGGSPGLVEDVWVGGRRIVQGGRHPYLDEAVRGYEQVVAHVFS
jgi:formimidoylglutamate deiminase